MSSEDKMISFIIFCLACLLAFVTINVRECNENDNTAKVKIYDKCLETGKSPADCRELTHGRS